jgi:hypothetical protein
MKISRFVKLMFIVFSMAVLTVGAVGTFAQSGIPRFSAVPGPQGQ